MKPIILVIVGAAMLMPAIHQISENKEPQQTLKEQPVPHKKEDSKKDTDVMLHNISLHADQLE